MINIAVFVSGKGSNLKAIYDQIEKGELPAKISAVISNNRNCGGIEFAVDKNIPTFIIVNNKDENLASYKDLLVFLSDLKVDLIVLAGFLKKIPSEFIKVYKNKIINIHPALLPKFGGKGMYGANVHKAVFNAEEKESGATVHFVDEIYDNGKIIEQRKVDISDVKSPEEIAERVLKIEHKLLPDVIKNIAVGLQNTNLFSENE